MDIKSLLTIFISNADKPAALNLLYDIANEKGYRYVINEILDPVLFSLGEEYADKGGISLALSYVTAKITEEIMEKCAQSEYSERSQAPPKAKVIMGNIEDDSHALGRRMVVTFLKLSGYDVHDMGNDVMPEEFVDKAEEIGARIIGVSAMMYTTARNILKVREEIDNRKLSSKIKLAVGGAVFKLRPDLIKEVGGDGTSRNALGAPSLFDELITALNKNENL